MSLQQCNGRYILTFAALSGLVTVALGAFAAHGLSARLPEYLLAVFKTGVQYQAWHSLALLACGILLQLATKSSLGFAPQVKKGLMFASFCFIIGILCFSGSLYGLALTGIKWFGPVTPFGGLMFMLGWAGLAFSAFKLK